MNRYVESLKSFLAEQAPCFGYDDADSILEVLYYYYSDANPVDNAVIRCQFKELNDILCRLPLSENEAIFSLTGDLCAAHERQAFLDGIHVGMWLLAVWVSAFVIYTVAAHLAFRSFRCQGRYARPNMTVITAAITVRRRRKLGGRMSRMEGVSSGFAMNR